MRCAADFRPAAVAGADSYLPLLGRKASRRIPGEADQMGCVIGILPLWLPAFPALLTESGSHVWTWKAAADQRRVAPGFPGESSPVLCGYTARQPTSTSAIPGCANVLGVKRVDLQRQLRQARSQWRARPGSPRSPPSGEEVAHVPWPP